MTPMLALCLLAAPLRAAPCVNSLEQDLNCNTIDLADEPVFTDPDCTYGSADYYYDYISWGCSVPVVIAGGEKLDTDEDVLRMVEGALKAGAKGVSIGRNAFQHDDPVRIVRAIHEMVHAGAGVADAKRILQS